MTKTLALTGIFGSTQTLMWSALGTLVFVCVVLGAAHSIRSHTREGAGSGITSMIGTIFHASLIALAIAIVAAVVAVARHAGVDQPCTNCTVQPWNTGQS